MSSQSKASQAHLERLLADSSGVEELRQRLESNDDDPPPRFPAGARITMGALDRRWNQIDNIKARQQLLDNWTLDRSTAYAENIENFVGSVKVPLGMAGPLRVNGLAAQGDFLVPLATTEAALVASFHRGAQLITAAGGCAAAVLNEGMNRSPAFAFDSIGDAGFFVHWALGQIEKFQEIVSESSNYAQLLDMGTTGEGNHVYLNFEFTTGDAAGQNMVTIATQRICDYILNNTPIKPSLAYIEGNLSGDKKASAQAFTTVRGKKVSAEIRLTEKLVSNFLHTSPQAMTDYYRVSAMGGVLSGT
ncbi:MAG: 3-hydroxy-3-methylglutaryl-CoA reductase, partial [Verrucomicrobiota bacterium]